jgi:voltage-gated sodium channel
MKAAAAYVTSKKATAGAIASRSTRVEKLQVYYLPYQQMVKNFYLSPTVQVTVAIIIFMNFVTAAIQSEILPNEDTRPHRIFVSFEYFYVYAFFIELLVNMYGHYFWEFWCSGWNWFDFIIVIISFLAMYFPDLPAIHVLRLFRAFRVVRIFKQVRKMRRIMEGIIKSLPGLSYAFVAMALIIGIWAIMGVDFFGEIVFDADGKEDVKLEELGDYYFGTFFRACLTLLQISTFDSWSSGIARDIIYEKGNGATVYFLSFIFIAGIIMMNVLVALLLDNYLNVDAEEREEPEDTTLSDLDNSAKYLNTKAIPGCVENMYNRHDSGVRTPSAIEMNVAKPTNGIGLTLPASMHSDVIYGILSRIEQRLSAIEDTNGQLTKIIKKLDNKDCMRNERGKSFRIGSSTTGDVTIQRVNLRKEGSCSLLALDVVGESSNTTMV